VTDSTYTHISLVADRSGSMESIQGDAQGAIRNFIKEQKAQPGYCTFTLAQFDNVYEIYTDSAGRRWENVDIQQVNEDDFVLVPRNMTALLDAWGRTMNATGEFLASLPEEARPGHVIFVVVTDGHENASREFKTQQIREMTERQRNEYSWEVVFLAANMDAVEVGRQFGVAVNSSLSYDASGQGAQASYGALSNAVVNVRSGKAKGVHFSDKDRQAAKSGS
jgi:hypothetical protein